MTVSEPISVVLPLYNKAKEIVRALASVGRQTLPPSEVIVVDDGSTDAGAGVVVRSSLPGLRVVRQENRGASAARNRGIAEAKSPLVAFLDADDAWHPEFLAVIAGMRRAYPGAGLYGTAWRMWDGSGRHMTPPFRDVPPDGQTGLLKSYFRTVSRGMCFCSSSVAVRKAVLEEVGGFPVGIGLGEDRCTWLRIAARYPVAFCSRDLAVVHLDAGSRSMERCSHTAGHPIIEAGLALLGGGELEPDLRRDLAAYVARTRIFVAKQLIRSRRPAEARRMLRECVCPTRFWLSWLSCMVGSLVPTRMFSLLYALRCRVDNWVRFARGRDDEQSA